MSTLGVYATSQAQQSQAANARAERIAAKRADIAARLSRIARTEHTFTDEAAAHTARRALINAGQAVSLIAYDPARSRYVFDSQAA